MFVVQGSMFDVLYISAIHGVSKGSRFRLPFFVAKGGGLGVYLNLGFGLWLNWTVKRREEIMG